MVIARMSPHPRYIVSVLLLLLIGLTTTSGQMKRDGPPSVTRHPVAMPRQLSDAAVADILRMAANPLNHGLYKSDGGTTQIQVLSNRALIAFNAQQTAMPGRYVPPPAMRPDVVVINCGQEDLRERFDCARVVVATPKGEAVAPMSYEAGGRSFRNHLGFTWTALMVTALYDVAPLELGFTVTFASPDTEWSVRVTAEDAHDKLLLGPLPRP